MPEPTTPPPVSQAEKDATPPPAAPTRREDTLRDLLMAAIGAERGREWNRQAVAREAARSPLSAIHFSVSVAALEAFDPWDEVPAACAIRAYTNNEFGLDLTQEAILRVRGWVCEYLDIDTVAADALPLSRVAEVLRDAATGRTPGEDPMAEFRWLKANQIAMLFGFNRGGVSKYADAGKFVTNGHKGHDRRIDVLSVVRSELARLETQAAVDAALEDEAAS